MLRKLIGFLLRCSHDRTTFPQGPRGQVHVTCLDCGREFAYDWQACRVIGPRATPGE